MENTKPFGIRDKLGYLFGDFGNDFTFLISSTFLLKFYTDVMGLDPYIVGLVMMSARFVDAFTDVIMGRICDKSRTTPAGKFKPWIRRMCAPVAIASFLIYQSAFANMSTAFKTIWLFATYILWGSIFYTSINIPYGSMASAISPEPDHRQSLSTFRTMGGALAGLIVGAITPLLVYKEIDGNTVMDGATFTLVAGVFSIFAVVCYLLCYHLTTERVKCDIASDTKRDSLLKTLYKAVKNRALVSIIAASVVMLLSQLIMQSMANYIYPNYYSEPKAQTVATFAMVLGMLFAALTVKPLSLRFGKAEISAAASLVASVISGILFIVRPENVWNYVLINLLAWYGLGIFANVTWALITDVIDFSEIKNNVREDGSIYALYSFARKLGQAAAAGTAGTLLSAIGYSDKTAFDKNVVEGVYSIGTGIPALGFFILALILIFWYPLKKREVEKNVEFLKKKRQ